MSGVSAVPDGSTLRPFIDTEVSNPPLLSWQKVKKATYYNLQLYKGRKKILSVWPKTPGLQLKKTWKFQRHRYSLSKGLYRWYVWPGLGRQSAHRYGTLMGSSHLPRSRLAPRASCPRYRPDSRPPVSRNHIPLTGGCFRACAWAGRRAWSEGSRAR